MNSPVAKISVVDVGEREAPSIKGVCRIVQWLGLTLTLCLNLVSMAAGEDWSHAFEPKPEPAVERKILAALIRLTESPSDVAAVETLLAFKPRLVEAVGTSQPFMGFTSPGDPAFEGIYSWARDMAPAETLVACLEKGSSAAVHWALRQIVWQQNNDRFDQATLNRMMPGIDSALIRAAPATRAQAVRAKLACLSKFSFEERAAFLKGAMQGQPDEVVATVMELFSGYIRRSDPELDVIAEVWLTTSNDPLLMKACCTYWWLVKSRANPVAAKVTPQEVFAFERLAKHPDTLVRNSVVNAIEGVATPAQPRLVNLLLQLTQDADPLVSVDAVRSLRNADTPEVNAKLHEFFAPCPPPNLRSVAMEVLGIFGEKNLPLILEAAKSDPEPAVRGNAIYALRHIGTVEAGRVLERAASSDPDKEIRRQAQEQFAWFQKEHPAAR